MTKPSDFIINTDYPTLKNDGQADATITIPASISIAGNGIAEYTADLTIGAQGAIMASRISSNRDSDTWYRAQTVVYTRDGITDGMPAQYSVAAFVRRVSATVVRCEIIIPNPYNTALTGASTTETVSFHVNTFIPPFA